MSCARYSCQIVMKLEFSRQIFGKLSDIKFNENPYSGIQVVPCRRTGQTDRQDEANSRFSQFCERAQKVTNCKRHLEVVPLLKFGRCPKPKSFSSSLAKTLTGSAFFMSNFSLPVDLKVTIQQQWKKKKKGGGSDTVLNSSHSTVAPEFQNMCPK